MSITAMKLALEALETCMYPQQKQMQAITALHQAIEQAEKQEPVGALNIWFYKGHGNYDFDYWGSLGEGTYTVHVAKSEAPSHNSTCNETLRAQGKSYPRTCKKCGLGPCVGKPKSDTAPPAAPVQGNITIEQARAIFRMARDLEDSGRICSLSDGQHRAEWREKNQGVQCALEDYLTNLTGGKAWK